MVNKLYTKTLRDNFMILQIIVELSEPTTSKNPSTIEIKYKKNNFLITPLIENIEEKTIVGKINGIGLNDYENEIGVQVNFENVKKIIFLVNDGVKTSKYLFYNE